MEKIPLFKEIDYMLFKNDFDLAEHEQMKARLLEYESTPDADKKKYTVDKMACEKPIKSEQFVKSLENFKKKL